MSSSKILWKEYKNITHPKTGLKQIKVDLKHDNIFIWNVTLLVVDPDSVYNGAYLTGRLNFPSNYPFSPPTFTFTPSIFHPNVYIDGRLCISILHSVQNETIDEPANLTWSPAQNVESVLMSVLSLLDDPNVNSPANVEASIAFRKQKDLYTDRVKKDVEKSKERIPKDFVMPTLDQVLNNKEEITQELQEDIWDDGFYDDDDDNDEDEDEDDESEDLSEDYDNDD